MQKDRRARMFSKRVAIVVVGAIATIAAACSDRSSPTEASRPAEPGVVSAAMASAAASLPNSFIAQGLLREQPLAHAVSATKVISNGGGTVDVPGTDFQLKIPKGAFVAKSMTFTVTALAGAAVAYDFEPHGAVFLAPLTFVQHLSHTNLKGVKLPPGFVSEITGAYFPSASMVDPVTGLAIVTELFSADITLHGNDLSFPISHFSGYMIATGRE